MSKQVKITRIILFFIYLLVVWGAYRFLWSGNYLWDELFFKPLLWLTPVLWLVTKLEGRKLISLGLVFTEPGGKILLGLGISFFILGEYLLALFLKSKQISFNPEQIQLYFWPFAFLSCVATGIVEEIVFRGYFMTRINEIIHSKLNSNIIAGLLFFLIHLPILIFDQSQG